MNPRSHHGKSTGRPAVNGQKKIISVNLRLSSINWLRQEAKRQKISMSELVDMLIQNRMLIQKAKDIRE